MFTSSEFRNSVKTPSESSRGKESAMKRNKESAEQSNENLDKKESAADSLPALPKKRGRKPRAVNNPIEEAAYFGEQYSKRSELENPDKLLLMLAPAVVEVIAGVRNITQLAAHLSEDVYGRLRDRSVKVAQERAKRGEVAMAPKLSVGSMVNQEPRDGVVESVVLVKSPTRTRAVTIRLEGINRRWRATAVSLI